MAWSNIIGHDTVKRLWQAHVAAGQLANAYLLIGPEGIGKRRLGLELAKTLNCTGQEPRPCDACPTCLQIAKQAHPDLHVLVPSGASEQIKIDTIRQLLGRVALRPFSARMQVVLLDGAERLTEEAANSLLKVLEEPPAQTRFVLLSAHVAHCLPTIVSRCQLLRCHPLSCEQIIEMLLAAKASHRTAAEAIARLCGGSASHALALAQRWDAYEALVQRFAHDAPATWMVQPLPETRQDVARFLEAMADWLRDMAVSATADERDVRHRTHTASLQRQAQRMNVDRCLSSALALVEFRESLEQFVSPRLVAALAREHWLSLTSD